MFDVFLHLRVENLIVFFGVFFVLIFLFWKIITRKKDQNFSDIILIGEVYKKNTFFSLLLLSLFITISLGYLFLLGNIYKAGSYEKIKKDGIDIVMVFDISYSMAAKDIIPSRLDAAKKLFLELSSALQNNRIGLVVFAGKAFQSVPLSYDQIFLENIIEDISLDMLSQNIGELQGTAIGDGLLMAANILTKEDEKREKVIILLSDGEANSGVDPNQVRKYLSEKKIKTYTIGLGKDETSIIEMKGPLGLPQKVQVGGIDEVLLKTIAEETGGIYFRVDSTGSIGEVIESISNLEKSALETEIFLSKKYLSKNMLLYMIFAFGFLGYIFWYKKIIIPTGNRS